MSDTTNVALRAVPGGGTSKPLTSEFSQIRSLPDFSEDGWVKSWSSHAQEAYEHRLPGSDRVVKVYIGDENFDGKNTVTITPSTGTGKHKLGYIPYIFGFPVNTENANKYWKERSALKK